MLSDPIGTDAVAALEPWLKARLAVGETDVSKTPD